MKNKNPITKVSLNILKTLGILDDLVSLLNERIADTHAVKGEMQSRHALTFYRTKVVNAIEELEKNFPNRIKS